MRYSLILAATALLLASGAATAQDGPQARPPADPSTTPVNFDTLDTTLANHASTGRTPRKFQASNRAIELTQRLWSALDPGE